MTTLSKGLSGATPCAASHGCCRMSCAVARCWVSKLRMPRTRSFAGSEMLGQGAVVKSRLPRRMEVKISFSSVPQKGGMPDSRMYSTTPSDQMSHSGP